MSTVKLKLQRVVRFAAPALSLCILPGDGAAQSTSPSSEPAAALPLEQPPAAGGASVAAAAPLPDVEAGRGARALERQERCKSDPRVLLQQVSLQTCVGADLFFRETFGGNGRTCASCHPASNNYTIDSAYIAKLPESDALFVGERDPELASLEDPRFLREFGLITVNADGFEDPTQNYVLRSVSHMLGLSVSSVPPPFMPGSTTRAVDDTPLPVPGERLGWSGDGAPGNGSLEDFADGAITQHATRSLRREVGRDFFLPDQDERSAIAAFSRSIGRMNDLNLNDVMLLDEGAQNGLKTFTVGEAAECAVRCHTNGGAIASIFESLEPDAAFQGPGNLTLDVGVELARFKALDLAGVPLDGGFGRNPIDTDGDGVKDSFGNGGFNVPPLIEAADTGPMFHTNSSATLEDAIRFYTTEDFALSLVGFNFFRNRERRQPIPLTETDIRELGRLFRVLNTALNLQMALSRMDAALEIDRAFGNRHLAIERGLLELAGAELEDALQVLGAVYQLHELEQGLLRRALLEITAARQSDGQRRRCEQLRAAREAVEAARVQLGTGLDFEIGEGTLMF